MSLYHFRSEKVLPQIFSITLKGKKIVVHVSESPTPDNAVRTKKPTFSRYNGNTVLSCAVTVQCAG